MTGTITSGAVIESITVSGTEITLHLDDDLDDDDTPSIDYASTIITGYFQDAAGNEVSDIGTAIVVTNNLDTTPPVVTGVTTSTGNGPHAIGDTVSIDVEFDTAVTVTGVPTLTLETGGTDAVVTLTGGSGTTTLEFDYLVAAGEEATDLDYESTAALTAGTSIEDGDGNTATLTLPAIGAAGSISDDEDVVIDGDAPSFSSATVSSPTQITVTVDQAVTDESVDFNDFTLNGVASGGDIGSIISVSGTSIVLGVTGGVIVDSDVPTLDYTHSTGTFDDLSGNQLLDFAAESVNNLDTFPPTFNSASGIGVTTILATFNEDLLDSSVDASGSDFTVAGFIVSAASENNGVVTLTVNGPLTAGDFPLDVTLVGSVSDGNSNVLSGDVIQSATNNIAPTFTAIRTAPGTIVLTFDQAVTTDAIDETLAWVLTSPTGTVLTVSNTGDSEITLTYSGDSSTDGTPTVTYDADEGTVHNVADDEVADGANAVASDGVAPTLSAVTIASDNIHSATQALVGDDIILSFTASESIATPTVTIAGESATVANAGGNNWTATITTSDITAQGTVSLNIVFADDAGNNGVPVTIVDDASSVNVSTSGPALTTFTVVSDNSISSNRAINDDDLLFVIISDDTIMTPVTGDLTVNGNDAIIVTTDSTGFVASYTVTAADLAEGALTLSLTIEDDAGNTSIFTQTSLTGENVLIDRISPTLESESLFGKTSMILGYSEQVVTDASDYTGIEVQDNTVDPATLNAVATGTVIQNSQSVIVPWTGFDASLTSGVEYDIATTITDLAGNTIDLGDPAVTFRVIPGVTDTSELSTTSVSESEPEIVLTDDTFVTTIVAASNVTPTLDISNLSAVTTELSVADEPVVGVPITSIAVIPETIEVQAGINTIEFPADLAIGFTGGATEELIISVDVDIVSDPDETFISDLGIVEDSVNAATLIEFGDPDSDIFFSTPVKVTIPGLTGTVISISTDGTTKEIISCERAPADSADAKTIIETELTFTANQDELACFFGEDIQTLHFSTLGFIPGGVGGGSGGCADCTPPTLGFNSAGAKLVENGFTYNGLSSDVQYFFTPFPLITSDVGKENAATFKIYEDYGPSNVSHISLAFGLKSGEIISHSKAMIEYDIDHEGTGVITVTDPENAIESDEVRVDTAVVECIEGEILECLEVTIYHKFRAPLEFDIVASDVWDRKRNAWQNYYNHGIHVDGVSLNPVPGVLVNDGDLRLYPLLQDSIHVKVMVDENHSLYKLAPDGNYYPLKNLETLFREVDESMYLAGEIPSQGYTRNDPRFQEYLTNQLEMAQAIINEMHLGKAIENEKFFNPDESKGMILGEETLRIDDLQLQAALEYEKSKAELLFSLLYDMREIYD